MKQQTFCITVNPDLKTPLTAQDVYNKLREIISPEIHLAVVEVADATGYAMEGMGIINDDTEKKHKPDFVCVQ